MMLKLPHLSLSRNNSPSRNGPATPPITTPTTPTLLDNGKFTASPPNSTEDLTQLQSAAESTSLAGGDREKQIRRASLGTLGAVLRRSTSFKANGSLTPSTAISSANGSGTNSSSRAASENSVGLPPLRQQSAAAKIRSVSSDRRPHGSAAAGTTPLVSVTAASPLHASSANSLPITQTNSQPALSRKSGKHSPTMTHSGTTTPSASTTRNPAALHNLEESYVGKVSLRLGEAVNKSFLPGNGSHHAPSTASILAGNEIVVNGRCAPKVVRAKEFGDLIVQELQAAAHDAYLLRTLLRSSVSKSLSLYLTRLTTLLLPNDQMGAPPTNLKEVDSVSNFMKFNLQIVRCAYQVKFSLLRASQGAPGFVRETLKPWVEKLGEVMQRVMNPLVLSIRIIVSHICAKARSVEQTAANEPTGQINSAAISLKAGGAQLRSLSLGRSASPAPQANQNLPIWLRELTNILEATAKLISRMDCGLDQDKWLVSVGTHAVWKGMLNLSARQIQESDGQNSVTGSAAVTATTLPAKIGLFKSVKKIPSPNSSPPLAPVDQPALTGHQNNSHPQSAVSVGVLDARLARVLTELEMLETRLINFIRSLSAIPAFDAHTLMSGTCQINLSCSLCKTGRTFDAESSDEDEADEAGVEAKIGAGGLALYAMREALQALSAMIVVVRASCQKDAIKLALVAEEEEETAKEEEKLKIQAEKLKISTEINSNAPLTPMSLIQSHKSLLPSPPQVNLAVTEVPPLALTLPASASVCPTLLHAVDTLPALVLLHLLASRIPHFKLPHQVWNLDWRAYEKELRGFAAGEEWTPEIGFEMFNEIQRIESDSKGEKNEFLDLLKFAIKVKVGIESNQTEKDEN